MQKEWSNRSGRIRFTPTKIETPANYASVMESSVPIVVQFTRQDTSQAENAIASLMAFPAD